VTHST